MQKRHAQFMQYPLQKTLNRVGKYVARGYAFAFMTFQSSTHMDFPEHDAECTLNIGDFMQAQPPVDHEVRHLNITPTTLADVSHIATTGDSSARTRAG
jgi:hypothetical protein